MKENKLKESQIVLKIDKLDKAESANIPKDKTEIHVNSKSNDNASSANCKLVPPSLDMKASNRDQKRICMKHVLKQEKDIAKTFNV